MACAETHAAAAHAAGIVGAAESGVPVRADGVHTGVPDDDADVRVSRRQDCAQLLLNCGLLRDFDLLLMVQWPVQLLEELYLAESLLQPFHHGPHWCWIVAMQVGAGSAGTKLDPLAATARSPRVAGRFGGGGGIMRTSESGLDGDGLPLTPPGSRVGREGAGDTNRRASWLAEHGASPPSISAAARDCISLSSSAVTRDSMSSSVSFSFRFFVTQSLTPN